MVAVTASVGLLKLPSEALIAQDPAGHTPSAVYLADAMFAPTVAASLTIAVRLNVAVFCTGSGVAVTPLVTGPRVSPIPAQTPPVQMSVVVQAFPSLHAVPFGAVGFEHWPVPGSHVPATWHWSDAEHETGFPPMQRPPWQLSVRVQALPSSQEFALLRYVHPLAGLQLSVVHGL